MNKFKVGDWVQFVDADGTRYFGKCTGIRDTYHSDYGDITVVDTDWADVGYFIQDIEYWQPEKGEWCWFWLDMSSNPELGQFKEMFNGDLFCSIQNGNDAFKFCEPFIGELPSYLKNKH